MHPAKALDSRPIAAESSIRALPPPEKPSPAKNASAGSDLYFLALFQAATFLVVFFHMIFLGLSWHVWGRNLLWLRLSLHLYSVGSGLTGLLISFTPVFRRHWRPMSFALAAGWMLSAIWLGALMHQDDLLTYEVTLLLAGSGALMPWEPGWQVAYALPSVILFASALVLSSPDPTFWPFRLLSVMTAAGIGQFAAALGSNYRRALSNGIRRLEEEGSQKEEVISELERTRDQLVVARERATQASIAKSEFLSSMSHEIRTPMNAVLGMADLLAETGLGADQRRYLDVMINNGNALLALINDILDLAKVETGRFELEGTSFDLADLTDRVCETLAVRAQSKHLELACRVVPGTSTNLIGDPLRLRQILVNLIGNSIKFTESGFVVLTVEQQALEAGSVVLHFSVADTGIGIEEDQVRRIFDNFTQADSSTTRKYGGSGLGLAIVKRLVELMHGRIWVESKLGEGSTFHFTARFEAGSGTVAAVRSCAEVGPRGSVEGGALPQRQSGSETPLRILLAEDSADNRFLIMAYLKGTPHRVEVADNGQIAVQKFMSGLFDVVLMDMQMPVMDGYAATREIRKLESERGLPRSPVIALTASALKEDQLESLDAGCDLHVSKPVKKAVLLDVLRDAVNRSRAAMPPLDTPVAPPLFPSEVPTAYPARKIR